MKLFRRKFVYIYTLKNDSYYVLLIIFEINILLDISSTDSQLKLWDLNTPYCTRTFRGHSNEKNFVGLATDGDYIACGKLFMSILISRLYFVKLLDYSCSISFSVLYRNIRNILSFFYITGSENNSLYLFYKGLSKQLLSFKFDVVRSIFVSVAI